MSEVLRRICAGAAIQCCVGGRLLFLLSLLLLSAALKPAAAQENPSDTTRIPRSDTTYSDTVPADTLRQDSVSVLDSLTVPKPPPTAPFQTIGAPLGSVGRTYSQPGYRFVRKEDIVWKRYFTAFDVLGRSIPAYPLSQGAPGLLRTFSHAGADPGSVAVLYDGRPMRNPGNDGFDLELYPIDFIERVEVLGGARALLYGGGEGLSALNLVQPRFDVEGSYARISYAQDEGNDLISTDLTYARNIADRLNLTGGIRRLSKGASGFPNQEVSSWSARGSLAWNVPGGLAVTLTELFSDATRGLNGGLTEASAFDPRLADAVNDTLRERTLRHDITLAAQWFPAVTSGAADTVAARPQGAGVPGDSLLRLDLALYYSYAERSLVIGSDERTAQIEGVDPVNAVDAAGIRAGMFAPLAFAVLEGNLTAEFRNGEPWLEAGGLLGLHPVGSVTLRGGGKFWSFDGESYAALVGEGVLSLGDALELRGTLRQYLQLQEPNAPDTLFSFAADRTGLFGELALELDGEEVQGRIVGFVREGVPRYDASDARSYRMSGAELWASVPLAFLRFEPRLLGTFAPESDRRFPLLNAYGDLFGTWTLINANLNLRAGTTLEYQTPFAGALYEPLSNSFLYPRDTARAAETLFPVWNVYIDARIGTAFIRAELRNILDVEYRTLFRYPRWERSLIINVSWALFD